MDREIILASNSPRRKSILEEFIDIQVKSESVDELYDESFSPHINSMSIAFNKAMAVAINNPMNIVIGADTLVFKKGPLGKPKDKIEAREMLKKLSHSKHEVITGCAIICLDEKYKKVFYESTLVYFKNLDEKIIEAYLNSNEYKDKAGAYGIQGKGSLLVEKIEGDFFNVVGLPISKLADVLLRDFGINLL